jgi:spermidine/putrescine transport system substrate-binding protein
MSEDLETTLRRMSETKVNRRGFLYAAGLTGAAAAIAACTSGSSSSSPAASTGGSAAPVASEVPSASASAAADSFPPAGDIEKELFMYNWSEYISLANIEAFKAKYGITKFQYDIYDSNDVLLAKLQGGATGYDIASPTAEYVPGMVEQGFVQKLDKSRLPNLANIDPKFKGLWWDPNDDYQIPKDFGTTGVLYRTTMIPTVPKSWKDFLELIKGPASGKTVFVDSMGDVFVFPLKMLGFSANSVDKAELDQARTVLLDVAPHLLALDSNKYGEKMAKGEAALSLGWTGVLTQDMADTPDKGYVVPAEGSIFWLGHMGVACRRAASQRCLRVAGLHPRPQDPG